MVSEATTGAWQRNVVAVRDTPVLLASSAVYHCVTAIATDVAKLPIKLTRKTAPNIWEEIETSPFLPVLRKPNHYQTRLKFIENWMISKLLHGNTYVLKQRDARGIVDAMYVLHPLCVTPFVAENGDFYYQLKRDVRSQQFEDGVMVPASEIIHDRMPELFDNIIGVSPLFACANAATLQARIMDSQSTLAGNRGMPGGIITFPDILTPEAADALKAAWQTNYSGDNVGKVAVLAEGMKFEALTMTALSQQLAEQLKFTVEDVARAFKYPIWKLLGTTPPYTKPDQAEVLYYMNCLQIHLEYVEAALDDGLSLPMGMRTEFDIDNLMRMDIESLYASNNQAQRFMTINEQRARAGLPPVEGGDTIYLQEQDHSLEALSERDEGPDPFGTAQPEPSPQPALPPAEEEDDVSEPEERTFSAEDLEVLYAADIRKELTTV